MVDPLLTEYCAYQTLSALAKKPGPRVTSILAVYTRDLNSSIISGTLRSFGQVSTHFPHLVQTK